MSPLQDTENFSHKQGSQSRSSGKKNRKTSRKRGRSVTDVAIVLKETHLGDFDQEKKSAQKQENSNVKRIFGEISEEDTDKSDRRPIRMKKVVASINQDNSQISHNQNCEVEMLGATGNHSGNEGSSEINSDDDKNYSDYYGSQNIDAEMDNESQYVPGGSKDSQHKIFPNATDIAHYAKSSDQGSSREKSSNLRIDQAKTPANTEYKYSDHMILKVWDSFISKKENRCKFYCCNHNGQSDFKSSLFSGREKMNIDIKAGLLICSDGKFYRNSEGSSVSICQAVDYDDHSEDTGENTVTSSVETALKQIKRWNEGYPNSKISDHRILFPYHRGPDHWTLCIIAFQLDVQGVLRSAQLSIYDPLGKNFIIQDKIKLELRRTLNNIMGGDNVELSLEDMSIEQQNDKTSCGAITAENGICIITGKKISEKYPKGAHNIRESHIRLVGNPIFNNIQFENKSYEDPQIQLFPNIDSIVNKFEEFLRSISGEKRKVFIEAFEELLGPGYGDRTTKIKRIFGEHKNELMQYNVGKNNLLDQFFSGCSGELEWKDNALDNLEYVVKQVIELYQSRSSSPIVDDSGYDSLCNEPNDPFNISSQQNSEDADKSKYKPDKKNSEPSKSVNQLEPSYHVSSSVFYYGKFNGRGLGNDESLLRKKFNSIIKDLEENKYTSQGDIKLITGDRGIKCFRAKLSDGDRLLFTSTKYNDKDAFVILEVILNHEYDRSIFLNNKEKIKNIKIIDENSKEVSDNANKVEIGDVPQVRWLGKFLTFSATQEKIVESAGKCELPLVVSGAAGSGKTSVALESLREMKEKFKGGKILYITKSENLVKESKKLLEYEHYNETTGKLKTCVPEEIEFLPVHELFEKLTGDIKGKKSINRSKFFSWFNEKCKGDKFKKCKKDGDKIFEEFIAVIAGGGLLGKEGKDQYVNLGDRQSVFPKEKREDIYDLFKEYKNFIEKSSKYYDTSLVAHECVKKVQKVYDAVVVDEVQDLTESTLDLILKSLKDESKRNFLLCGDVNQVIHPSFFSKSRLKSFLDKNKYVKNNGPKVFCTLEKNYRNSEQVIELANRILHFKNRHFASEDKMTADEKGAFFMKSDTENTGNVGFIAKDKEQEIAEKVPGSINWAVLVLDDESKEDARKLFGTPLVFSIQEAKGLEFKNVILYKFTSHEAYNKIWNIACSSKDKKEIEDTINKIRNSYKVKGINTSRNKDKKDKSFEEYKFYMNALYVGVTRAIDNVYITGDKSNLLKAIEPEKKDVVDIKKEESSPEEWRDMALKLIDEGNVEQAENIAKELLCKGEKEYGKEIMRALEDKGYHIETPQKINDKLQSSLDKDKSEQTISESKIDAENPSSKSPQKCSVDESPTKKARTGKRYNGKKHKAEQNLNKDQKKKPEKNQLLVDAISNDRINQFKGIDISQYDKQEVLNLALERFGLRIADYLLGNQRFIEDCSLHTDYLTEDKGFTLLHFAAEDGYNNVVEFFLKHEANVNATRGSDGCTALHLAAAKGYNDVVKVLLEYGAKVDAKANNGCTALHLAVQRNCKDIAKLLVEHGADVNAKCIGKFEGLTPLHLAVQRNFKDVVDLLLQHKDVDVNAKANIGVEVNANGVKIEVENYTPLHLAAENNCKDVVKLLLEHGAKVDAKDSRGHTPLHVAAGQGHVGVVEFFLKNGVKADVKDEGGLTPLHSAAENNCKDVVKLLLEHGANVNARGKVEVKVDVEIGDYTSLHLAAQQGHVGVVKLLLENKAKVDVKNEKGYTPLYLAAAKGKYGVVELLLKHGADVNAKAEKDFTPLHVAAEYGCDNVVKLLLKHGADVNAKAEKDFTPLHIAAAKGKYGVVELLLKHGVDVNAMSKNCVTPLLLALEYSCTEVFDLLVVDPNINVSSVQYMPSNEKNKRDYEKYDTKYKQDTNLFYKVGEAANEKDTSKRDELLKEVEKLLKPEDKYGFKPSLNYSRGVGGKTTIEIAIKAGGKVLQLLYDYAEKNIGADAEIFKQLKRAKENSQPKSDVSNVSVSGNLIQAQGFKLGGA